MWASHFVRNGNKLSISSWLATEVQVCRNVSRPNPRRPNLVLLLLFFYFKNKDVPSPGNYYQSHLVYSSSLILLLFSYSSSLILLFYSSLILLLFFHSSILRIRGYILIPGNYYQYHKVYSSSLLLFLLLFFSYSYYSSTLRIKMSLAPAITIDLIGFILLLLSFYSSLILLL